MRDLIKALNIFMRYNPDNKIHLQCEHDELYVCGIDPLDVTESDKIQLEELGFFDDGDCFVSFRYRAV